MAEDYESLRAEFEKAAAVQAAAFEKAKTREEREAALRLRPDYASFNRRFLEVARRDYSHVIARDSLLWVFFYNLEGGRTDWADSALDLLREHHAADPIMAPVCAQLAIEIGESAERFLREVAAKSRDRSAKAEAHFSLGRVLLTKYEFAQLARLDTSVAISWRKLFGEKRTDYIVKADPNESAKESAVWFQRVIDEFGDVQDEKGAYGPRARGYLFEVRDLANGRVAPEIVGQDREGKQISLSQFRGMVVILDFWGVGLGSGGIRMFDRETLMQKYKGRPFTTIGVFWGTAEKLREWPGMVWPHFIDGSEQGPISTTWNVDRPTTYVIDSDGVIRGKNVDREALDRLVAKLVQEAETKAKRKK